mgnify:CR=1 FL=1
MSLAAAAASFVADLALGAWFGAMAFFSFVAAPTTFSVLGTDDAGPVVNEIFPTYYQVGLGLGFVALGGIGVTDELAGLDYYWVAYGATAVAIVAAAYARYRLIPKMEAAGDDAFSQYHSQSVALNALAMLAVLVALAATHA